ncbi:MAG: type II secretion system F family protein [Flavipsychrobacter sp.]|nr:type II secretion system F family protein [Flavipsychrobacter sp.]
MLLSAGVDLQTVLELSAQVSNKKSKLITIYENILAQIIQGSSLAEAMQATKQFSNFDSYSILIGENTGELAQVFNKLTMYYNKRIAQKRKITSALSYPVIVLLASVGAIYFMLKFVVPMFSDTLTRFGGELPPLTKFIITLSHNISSYILILTIVLGTGYLLYYRNKEKENVQQTVSAVILKIPVLGKIIYKTYLLQFTQAMDLLLNSKVNIVESIDLTQKMIQFYPLTKALKNIKKDLLLGDFFYHSMEKQSFFDQSMITLIKIGEEVNQLDKIFVQLSKQYESELEYQFNILFTILEPIMILFLAIMVAIILIAMYLPMFKLGTVIH